VAKTPQPLKKFRFLLLPQPHLERIGKSLVTTANRLGGEDNTTVVLIGLDSDETLVKEAGVVEEI